MIESGQTEIKLSIQTILEKASEKRKTRLLESWAWNGDILRSMVLCSTLEN